MTDKDETQDLDELGQRIQREREAAGLDKKPATSPNKAMGEGFRVAIELVVSVAVGVGLGYWIGNMFGQGTIGLVVGMFLGFAAGLRTVHRFLVSTLPSNDGNEKQD